MQDLSSVKLAFDAKADEVWCARGVYGDAPMLISVARTSSHAKLGVIPTSALGGDGAVVAGIALSGDEAFVATGCAIKVFSRTEREDEAEIEDVDQLVCADQEIVRGYVLKRELAVAEPVRDLIWSHGKLVVCTQSGVRILRPDGKELRSWMTTAAAHASAGPALYAPRCAAVCESRGGARPHELAVLDTSGNIHFYT